MIFLSCPLEGSTGHQAAYILLERAYAAQTGQKLPPIARTACGKPYFPDSPYHFSISHTPRHAFCVLSTHPVGLDAEELDRRVDPRLAEKILSPGEYRQYLLAENPNLALLKFWVLKEAAAKLSGLGLRGYPRHTDFSLDDPRLTQRDGCIVALMEA